MSFGTIMLRSRKFSNSSLTVVLLLGDDSKLSNSKESCIVCVYFCHLTSKSAVESIKGKFADKSAKLLSGEIIFFGMLEKARLIF